MSDVGGGFDAETVRAVMTLLAAAEENGVAVAFTPDADGWRLSYLSDWPAYTDDKIGYREIAVAHDLRTSADAAFRPVVEFGRRLDSRP